MALLVAAVFVGAQWPGLAGVIEIIESRGEVSCLWTLL